MGFSLKNMFEEAWADINPFDGGRTGATVRQARQKAAPVSTPPAGTSRPTLTVGGAAQPQSLSVAPVSKVHPIDTIKVATASDILKQPDLQVKEAAQPHLQPPQPPAPAPQPAPRHFTPDQQNTATQLQYRDKLPSNDRMQLYRKAMQTGVMSRAEMINAINQDVDSHSQKLPPLNPVEQFVGDTVSFGQRVANTGEAAVNSVTGAAQGVADAVTHNPNSRLHQQALDAQIRENLSRKTITGQPGSFISYDQAQNKNGDMASNFIKPIVSTAMEALPYVAPYGAIAKTAEPVAAVVTQATGSKLLGFAAKYSAEGAINAPIFASQNAVQQGLETGTFDPLQATKAGIVGGVMAGAGHAGADVVHAGVSAAAPVVQRQFDNAAARHEANNYRYAAADSPTYRTRPDLINPVDLSNVDPAAVKAAEKEALNGRLEPVTVMIDENGMANVVEGHDRLAALLNLDAPQIPTKSVSPAALRSMKQGGYIGKGATPQDPAAEIAQLQDHLKQHGGDGNYSQDNFMAEQRLRELQGSSDPMPAPASGQAVTSRVSEANPTAFDEFMAARPGRRVPLKDGEKLSRFANKTIQESDEVSDPLKQLVNDEQVTYDATTDAGRADSATKLIDSMPTDKAFGRVMRDLDNPKAADNGQRNFNAIELAKRLDSKSDEESLTMATEILHKLSENASKQGQELQALAYLNNRTPQGLLFGAMRDLDKADVKITPEIKQALDSLKEEVAKHPVGSDERNFAVYNLSKFVTSKIPVGTPAKILNFWRAGLLTAPTTTGGNILGNTGEAVVRNMFVNPAADLADVVMSKFTGKRSFSSQPGFMKGAKEGAGKLEQFMKTGYDERNALSKYDTGEMNYGEGKVGTAIGKYVNGVYRLMSVADQPFWYGARNESLAGLARVEALNRHLKGAEADKFMNEFLDNPPKSALEQATKEAKYATFQNETLLGDIASGAKQRAGDQGTLRRAAVDFFVPFTQVPASIATRVVQRTPVGTGAEIVKQIINVKNGKPFDQRAMAKAFGEGAFGTGVFAAGYALANSGMLTFGYPDDPKEQALWQSEKKQPYSVKIGDRWYSLNYLQPFGTLLAVGGNAANSIKDGSDAISAVSQGIATAGQAVMNQSFLKGISGVLDAIDDPKRYAENWVENTASSAVPNAIRSLANATDPLQRDVKGVKEGIQSAIPGLREKLPAKQDMFGQDVTAKDNAANQYLNPLRPSKVKNDDVVGELRRLQDAGEGIVPPSADKGTFKDTTLDRKQVSDINRLAGKAMKAEYAKLMADPKYQSMSDAQKADSIKKINDTVFGAVKLQYAKDNNIATTTEMDKNQKRFLNGQPVTFLSQKKSDGSAADNIDLAPGLVDNDRKTLSDYDTMTTDERDKLFNDQKDAEYKYELAKYNNDALNGTLTKAEDARARAGLAKSKVGSGYSKETRDLYSLNKDELYSIISTDKNGKKMAEDVLAYGDALAAAGVSKNKFRTSKGAVSFKTVKGGSGSSRGKSSHGLSYKMDGYLNTATTSKSLRDLLKEAKITGTSRKPS